MNTGKIQFSLIETIGNQRFYKSSILLNKGYCRLFGKIVEYDYDDIIKNIKPEYKHFLNKDGFDAICISDANEHAERLAFAAICYNNKFYTLHLAIEGINTMKIYGGDPSTIFGDEKYLRLIARHNGFSQNNVIIK